MFFAVTLGFEPIHREKTKELEVFTLVFKQGFTASGEVRSFELYSGATYRALRVGIYRPTGTTCEFTLVQQKEWPSFKKGYNKVPQICQNGCRPL